MSEISEQKSETILTKQLVENISKRKASRSGFIGNLMTKCINKLVLIFCDNSQNYDEVCLLRNFIEKETLAQRKFLAKSLGTPFLTEHTSGYWES